MRLTDEQIKEYRLSVNMPTCWKDDGNCRECSNLPMCNLANKLLDAIEAQQQENEQLKDAIKGSKVIVDVAQDELAKAKQEIEQLKAQNAAMREALDKVFYYNHCTQKTHCSICGAVNNHTIDCPIGKALSTDAGKDYHNPADIAKIEQLEAQLESLRCCACGEIPATVATDDGQYCDKCAEELGAVEVVDLLTYHNPADVEALKKAREAIKAAWSEGSSANVAMDKASETLAAIDKVIGGGE